MKIQLACKILLKYSQPFGKKFRKPQGIIFLSHTVYLALTKN